MKIKLSNIVRIIMGFIMLVFPVFMLGPNQLLIYFICVGLLCHIGVSLNMSYRGLKELYDSIKEA